ncbi:hypothetical protein CLV24_101198 [Pontibacter ummariensis]|uniref:Uncharacterized protein n=1 Tax=Pontibacter ummariensis TaxID=1610492 RepID=A0A239B721_9BACT|nr:hypothetical protein [Pontibacter ummariensis]PRY16353.1 hypothetical protein CLV24_101198 [Pontibacter ummariensis]SNS03640.1 hypothetical protein SAMN06296052_101198 [Pontibacter ummariensis]
MKNFFCKHILYFLPILCGLFLAACGDDDMPDPTVVTTSGMSAVVNGADWSSSNGNFKLGNRTITDGASAFVGSGDTLTIIGVQALPTDTTAIMLSVKLSPEKVGTYQLRSGTAGQGKAYFLTKVSGNALAETKEKYGAGITNGNLRITSYDAANYSVSGDFAFSMSATGETTYTVVAGEIDNVTF